MTGSTRRSWIPWSRTREMLAPQSREADAARLRRESQSIETELLRLTDASARGGEVNVLVDTVKARQPRRAPGGARRGDRRARDAGGHDRPEKLRATLRALGSPGTEEGGHLRDGFPGDVREDLRVRLHRDGDLAVPEGFSITTRG